MFSWYPVMDLARAPRGAARKKGSGYEYARRLGVTQILTFSSSLDMNKLIPRRGGEVT